MTANKDKPFFVYLPHTMVHDPVHSSEKFRGKSANGGYGDATEEIDWSTALSLIKFEGIYHFGGRDERNNASNRLICIQIVKDSMASPESTGHEPQL